MSQSRKMRRKSGISKKEQERLDKRKKESEEGLMTKISRIVIMIVFAATVISLAYTAVALSGY